MAVPLLSGTLNVTDKTADLESESRLLDEAASDRYAFIRNACFQERADKIHEGNPPLDENLEMEIEKTRAEKDKK